MRAIRLHSFGPAENLRYEEAPDPVPAEGEVRIRVAAAGVHLVDTALREGLALGPTPVPVALPTIPGREVAGTVDAVGPGVAETWRGRRVVAHLGMAPGGYAELAVTGAERLHVLPDAVSEAHALAMVGTGRTAMGVLQFAELGPEDTVVVLAAAGGIGNLLVQYARSAGARVVGVAGGPEKVAAVRGVGADLAVDYTDPGWAERVTEKFGRRPATYLLEGVGGPAARTAIGLLAKGGTHLSYGYAATGFDPDGQAVLPPEEAARLGVDSRSVLGPPMFERIGGMENVRVLEERALGLVAAGTVTPLVRRYPLAEAARAHRELELRGTVGKVVLVPV
ncbi:zinc-binding dehydrogenase [Streptomyces alkaliterrae]|uniref:Zinc-binding dehydrogenase n=1 Tax=Streptomyces alkaliterrae TaxID=2213162 RepID=A0A5P0YXX6_9ACTN|nr:zinc-binding dehydrogenase [Streptomyces alkaliterrae]MBB1262042.1 zinc-binding dehydrogenase [Streptomyces alkaliterrae]MQS05133.1 zinc-binding dehydrogenase [Streptomyces alkaliterrae]